MRALCLLVVIVLASGCTGAQDVTATTPSSPSAPSDASPTPTTPAASPSPATPPPTAASPTPTPAPTPAPERKSVTWSYTVTAAHRASSLPGSEGNCIVIPAARILGGNVTATWTSDAPVIGTTAELVVTSGTIDVRTTGTSNMSLELPEIPAREPTKVAVFLTDAFEDFTVPEPVSVELKIVFFIPASNGAPGEPGAPSHCEYPGGS